jgi:glycosyltransferase involved in cell wall biosynthesis
MPQPPTVTIAIPTYNRVVYLRKAVESALSQTYPNIQIIVSDNCSGDGTAEFVSSITDSRLLFLQQPRNLGMVGNWNVCLEHATGEFFLLLSDDDYLEDRAIETLVEAIAHADRPDQVGLACCRAWEVDQRSHKMRIDPACPAREEAKQFALEYFRGKRKMHLCSTLLRTADLREIGGYTQGTVALTVDAIVWGRILLRRGAIIGVNQPLASYRIHPGRITSSSRMQIWQHDHRALLALWSGPFEDSPAVVRRRFAKAARHYESWEIAAIINSSANSWSDRLRALGVYWACRTSFAGLIGIRNLAGGIIKLLVPEILKRPVRNLQLRAQVSRMGHDLP